MKKFLLSLLLFSLVGAGYSINPLKVMKRIDRQTKRLDNCKCLSKVQEINGNTVKFYFKKNNKLVKIIEKRIIDGATVFRYFYFDKKSGEIISVNLVGTIFYYYDSEYFAIISRDNYSENLAEEKGDQLKETASTYIEALK